MSPRRVIAALGRTLITAGVLLLLFVAYQLWGTGIAYAQRQNKAEKTFEAQLAAAGIDPNADLTAPVPTTTTVPPTTVAPTTVPAADDPVVVGDAPTTVPTTRPAPVVTSSTLPKVRAGRSQMQRPKQGAVLGRMVIKRIKLDQIVVEGSDKESLKTGPGHYRHTPMPGQPGNAAVACHRTTYGAPCFNLDLLSKGDEILVQTLQGTFRYIVDTSWRVGPKDSTVLAPTPDRNVLTLTTCDPKYSAARRLIVRAVLDGPALPSDLYVEPEPLTPAETAPSEDTVAPATTEDTLSFDSSTVPVAPGTDAVTADTTVAGASSSDTAAAAAANPGPPAAGSADLQTVDPEGTGPIWSFFWFRGHRSTWLSMGFFALVCAGIWIGVWRVARRRRFVAQAIIYVPAFLVLFSPALFFCFENVARLLPDSV